MIYRKRLEFFCLVLLGIGLICLASAEAQKAKANPAALAKRILDATGIKGGLIVHVGCGNGALAAELASAGNYLVHGLDADAPNVRRAREQLKKAGVYGAVSVEQLSGATLPYIDNLVNLLVSQDLGEVPMKEVLRVLAPEGVAYIRQDGKWIKTVKPRPEEIDEWTHYLHDSTGNAVAHDSVVGPPRRLQWVGSPRWSRHHDRMASMSALVSSGGRIFYIFDEGPTESIQLPDQRMLIARDAFNGVILWKRPIDTWHPHLWPFKSGPAHLPRRLVAVGDRVYVTLGLSAPLTALDATTGEVVRTYGGSNATEEVIASDGVLFVLVNEEPVDYDKYKPTLRHVPNERTRVATEWAWNERERNITAFYADTGKELWSKKDKVVPLTLAADGKHVVFHDGESIVCLDRTDGEEKWRSEAVSRKQEIPTSFGPTLVIYEDVVLFSGGDRLMCSLDLATGNILWSENHPRSGHNSPEDLLVVNGLAWAGQTASGSDTGIFTGRDPHTGQIKGEFPPDVDTHWFHQRCYRSKATDKYLLPSRTGIEFVDVETEHWEAHHWVRGGCLYGIMPCNGLVYSPPHSCGCYLDAKLSGFTALAPEGSAAPATKTPRLQRGPAYDKEIVSKTADGKKQSYGWPTYRHDAARSGRTNHVIPAELEHGWSTEIGGKLSSVVVGANTVLVAEIDAHTVHALDAVSGEERWSFTAGGRIDSPPTFYAGRVLFGSADGYVYCLSVRGGGLIWRFRAAPEERRMVAFEQVESPWPVSGSVLVQDGVVRCVAGRSMFVDGGMRLCKLDVETGELLSEVELDDRDPETGQNLQVRVKTLNMPTSLPDVLSSDGEHLYMRTQRFDMDGIREELGPIDVSEQEGEGVHLFSSIGFLDGSWFHRGYMVYGRAIASGAGGWWKAGRFAPAGRILVFDDKNVYGYGRKPEYFRWTTPNDYRLFSSAKHPETIELIVNDPVDQLKSPPKPQPEPAPKNTRRNTRAKRKPRGGSSAPPSTQLATHWSEELPVHVRAMVLARKTLFVAGPPDILDEEEVYARYRDPLLAPKLEEQVSALRGKEGASLIAVSAEDGKKLAEYKLDAPPVWDGMAAAKGSLFFATTSGNVVCMKGKTEEQK